MGQEGGTEEMKVVRRTGLPFEQVWDVAMAMLAAGTATTLQQALENAALEYGGLVSNHFVLAPGDDPTRRYVVEMEAGPKRLPPQFALCECRVPPSLVVNFGNNVDLENVARALAADAERRRGGRPV